MRLLKTKSYELFEASDIPSPFPSYAILSHTWISSKDEITYQDMKSRTGDIKNNVYKQKGWSKLKGYCDRAAKDGWEWAWMDTCCIDKTNPADTQEAINAMFRWYQNAGICYAHLDDVNASKTKQDIDFHENTDLNEVSSIYHDANPNTILRAALKDVFVRAKWFTRGWTLQELLAPHYLIFVDYEWRHMGTRESWAQEIEKASNIEATYLTAFNPTDFVSCSTAMRFSWASGRETTVEEDESYSLLGLFGISLPLIYGEGGRQAFNRLQRQLIQVYHDDSVFAWKDPLPSISVSKTGWGILARSVKDFWDASKVRSLGQFGNTYSMTNRGLEITSKCCQRRRNPIDALIRLNCSVGTGSSAHTQEAGIYLTYDVVTDTYHRARIDELCDTSQIYSIDWKENERQGRRVICADNYTNRPDYSSMFVVKYPERVSIIATFAAEFSPSAANYHIQPLSNRSQGTLTDGVRAGELSVGPSSVAFLNIEVEDNGAKHQLDVIASLTQNGFPHVGILARGEHPWERLRDPFNEEFEIYNALAEHIHFTPPSDQNYPLAVKTKMGELIISAHVLPKPARSGLQNLGREMVLREYMLRISISRYDEETVGPNTRQVPTNDQDIVAKRQRIL